MKTGRLNARDAPIIQTVMEEAGSVPQHSQRIYAGTIQFSTINHPKSKVNDYNKKFLK